MTREQAMADAKRAIQRVGFRRESGETDLEHVARFAALLVDTFPDRWLAILQALGPVHFKEPTDLPDFLPALPLLDNLGPDDEETPWPDE